MKINKNLVMLAVLALVLGACAPATVPAGDVATRSISVNGTGTVTLEPDMATVFIGVSTENESAADALAENNRSVQSVMDTLLAFSVAEEDIQTANFSIWPRSDYNFDGEIIGTVYNVQNTVVVTVRNLDSLGGLLDAVVQSGANTISGINFGVEDTEGAYNQAMEAAVGNARARAEILAGAAEVTLDVVQSISTFSSGSGVVEPYGKAMAMDAGMGGGGQVPISGGQLEITVQVTVAYTIK